MFPAKTLPPICRLGMNEDVFSLSVPLFVGLGLSWKPLAFNWAPCVRFHMCVHMRLWLFWGLPGWGKGAMDSIGGPERPSRNEHSQRSKSQPQNREQHCRLPPGHSFNAGSYSSADHACHCCLHHHHHHSFPEEKGGEGNSLSINELFTEPDPRGKHSSIHKTSQRLAKRGHKSSHFTARRHTILFWFAPKHTHNSREWKGTNRKEGRGWGKDKGERVLSNLHTQPHWKIWLPKASSAKNAEIITT